MFRLLILCIWLTFFTLTESSSQPVTIDLTKGVFCTRGSYLSFTRYMGRDKQPSGLYLMTVTRRPQHMDLFALQTIDKGEEVPSVLTATPALLSMKTNSGEVRICFESANIIRIKTKNLGLRLSPPIECKLMQISDTTWRYQAEWTERFLFTRKSGIFITNPSRPDRLQNEYSKITMDILPDKRGNAEFIMEYYLSQLAVKEYNLNFEKCLENKENEFNTWLSAMPSVPDRFKQTLVKAAYVNWSSLISPRDLITREGMMMSKMWMNGIWSWDHCFNAMSLGYSDPKLAFDQIMVVFDRQNLIGALPDDIYENHSGWGYLKPPIHGWTLRCMMEKSKCLTQTMIEEIYVPLCRWTDFYFNFKDDNHNGLAESYHGNDSGADNATIFDDGMPVDDPALNSYLIIQMDILSDFALKLGKPGESEQWKHRANKLYSLLMTNLWDGNKFVCKQLYKGSVNNGDFCHIRFMPLMLAGRLPADVRKKLIAGLKDTLLTEYGIASEGIKSPKFDNIGYAYWRGPIWAPTTYMLIDALDRCGEKELARDIANRFCEMVKREGFAENFDPVSGKGLCDPVYTWTSSVFILLAHEYCN